MGKEKPRDPGLFSVSFSHRFRSLIRLRSYTHLLYQAVTFGQVLIPRNHPKIEGYMQPTDVFTNQWHYVIHMMNNSSGYRECLSG